jgi:hypothetical protein
MNYKKLSTERLLSLYGTYHCYDFGPETNEAELDDYDREAFSEMTAIKAELDTREHIPSPAERKKIRNYIQKNRVTEQEAKRQLNIC